MDDYIFHLEMSDNEDEAHRVNQHAGIVDYTRDFTIQDYTLRVTGKTKEQILNSLKKMVQSYCDGVELYVVGFEKNHNLIGNHCHVVFEPWAKGKIFRQQVKEIFDIKKATNYSLSKIRDSPIKALSYVLKDGDYNVGCHVAPKQLETARKLCFGKGSLSFKKKHQILLESLAESNNRKRYFKQYVELKIHHNQKIYWHHIKAHCTTVFMRMDKYYKNDLIDSKWVESGLMSKEESNEYYGN